MFNFQSVIAIVVCTPHVFSEYRTLTDTRLFRILTFFGVTDPMRMFSYLILQHITVLNTSITTDSFIPI